MAVFSLARLEGTMVVLSLARLEASSLSPWLPLSILLITMATTHKLYGEQACFFDMEEVPRIKHRKKGTVSMVNNGNKQHGSQFLITTADGLDYLDGVHTVFGEVTEGLDVLDKINQTFVDQHFVPFQDIRVVLAGVGADRVVLAGVGVVLAGVGADRVVLAGVVVLGADRVVLAGWCCSRINHTVVLEDPFDDPPDLPVPERSPEPTEQQLDSGRIGADEVINDSEGRATEELEELLKEKEAKTQAILLEMVGDLPDAEVKPPENVLFVCKLNPVTTDEDLEIIFSRFGSIQCCEIIRDWKSGESLCYAFIEFEKVSGGQQETWPSGGSSS
ncbi:hypothetical protein CRUP_036988 [Coryphaenoides rupestris]|nr:hypothetical protein CRUP_036988 [Coryphaenoides rupestris]